MSDTDITAVIYSQVRRGKTNWAPVTGHTETPRLLNPFNDQWREPSGVPGDTYIHATPFRAMLGGPTRSPGSIGFGVTPVTHADAYLLVQRDLALRELWKVQGYYHRGPVYPPTPVAILSDYLSCAPRNMSAVAWSPDQRSFMDLRSPARLTLSGVGVALDPSVIMAHPGAGRGVHDSRRTVLMGQQSII